MGFRSQESGVRSQESGVAEFVISVESKRTLRKGSTFEVGFSEARTPATPDSFSIYMSENGETDRRFRIIVTLCN